MQDKVAADLMWVIKRPIKDLESRKWPEYNHDTLLSSESRNNVFYLTKCKSGDSNFDG